MVDDATLAHFCMSLYNYPWYKTEQWDHTEEDDGLSWALKRYDGNDVIIFRGSETPHDWFFNFMALAIPIDRGPLGPIHPGFHEGCPEAWAAIKPLIRNPLVLTGHSLGGAHAAIIAAMAMMDEVTPVRRVTFGEPRPGFRKLAHLTAGISSTLYHNMWDIVPEVPVMLPPIENYCHDRPMSRIRIEPHSHAFDMGPFAWHHMMLYEEFFTKGN